MHHQAFGSSGFIPGSRMAASLLRGKFVSFEATRFMVHSETSHWKFIESPRELRTAGAEVLAGTRMDMSTHEDLMNRTD